MNKFQLFVFYSRTAELERLSLGTGGFLQRIHHFSVPMTSNAAVIGTSSQCTGGTAVCPVFTKGSLYNRSSVDVTYWIVTVNGHVFYHDNKPPFVVAAAFFFARPLYCTPLSPPRAEGLTPSFPFIHWQLPTINDTRLTLEQNGSVKMSFTKKHVILVKKFNNIRLSLSNNQNMYLVMLRFVDISQRW